MKKTVLILALIAIVISGCSKELHNQEIVDKGIDEAKETLDKEDATEIEKAEAYIKLASNQEAEGQEAKAIKNYELALAIDNDNYVALNNLGNIYEDRGEYRESMKYRLIMITDYLSDFQVVKDAIRTALKLEDPDLALEILTSYAKNYQSDETSVAISKQFEYIQRVREKLEDEASQ